MIHKMQEPASEETVAAMNRFVSAYWRPVYYYLRARHVPVHGAEDLVQEFFLRFLSKNWVQPADPGRGRFRAFLLTIVKRFLADQSPHRAPRQRTFDDHLLSISALISDEERSFDPADYDSPDDIFMTQWAHAVVNHVRRMLQTWCEGRGRPDWYQIFSEVHFPPPGVAAAAQQNLAERFRISRDQIRYCLEMTSNEFASLLRKEVADQVGSQDEVDAELSDLLRLLEA